MNTLPLPLLYALGYLFLLIGALIGVSIALNRLTREERRAERARRLERYGVPAGKPRARR